MVTYPTVQEYSTERPQQATTVRLHPLQLHNGPLRVTQLIQLRGVERCSHGQGNHQDGQFADPHEEGWRLSLLAADAARRAADDGKCNGANETRGQLGGVDAVGATEPEGATATHPRGERFEGHGQQADGGHREGLPEVACPMRVAHGERCNRQDRRLHEDPHRPRHEDAHPEGACLLAGRTLAKLTRASQGEPNTVWKERRPHWERQGHPGKVQQADAGQNC
mmetsp:Transcript_110143/g.322267  ORF Transcript_110143/g.322267 Transcript_110143/m.322267 type:complete len:223 (-) Transcript_110143:1730-2398(-)